MTLQEQYDAAKVHLRQHLTVFYNPVVNVKAQQQAEHGVRRMRDRLAVLREDIAEYGKDGFECSNCNELFTEEEGEYGCCEDCEVQFDSEMFEGEDY